MPGRRHDQRPAGAAAAAAAAVALLLAVMTARAAPRHKRIVGGSDAAIADFPWMLSLEYDGAHTCGASIIGRSWALTAKSCVNTDHFELLQLRAGSATRGAGGVMHNVTSVVRHYLALPTTMDYDFALVQIADEFAEDLTPAALPAEGYDPPAGTAVVTTGWGRNGTTIELPTQLQQVSSEVLERSGCQEQLGTWYVTDHMICAGATTVGLVCYGDIGGPLVSGNTLLGVVPTTGVSCDEQPSVFCSVADIRQWITNNTGI